MHVKLLLDENLSPAVAVTLCKEGYDGVHVRDRALRGATDAAVLQRAFEEDRVLVTANVADFEKLARSVELHGGIVLVEDGELTREEQREVLRRALDVVGEEHDAGRSLVNRVLRMAGAVRGPPLGGP